MRKLEGLVKEIVDDMGYLRSREERFSDTNCESQRLARVTLSSPHAILVSTNKRVQSFAWFTIFALTALGAWQILHLRAYFKRKYLID